MIPAILLLASAGMYQSADTLSEISKGSALFRGCQAEIRLMKLPGLKKARESDLLNGAFCIGYLNGFTADLNRTNTICANHVAMGWLVVAYVAYMKKNPNLLVEDRAVGLDLALQDAYPCAAHPAPNTDASDPSRAAL